MKKVRVRMLTIAAGPAGNLQPGDEVELTEELAKKFVEGRYAAYVTPPEATAIEPAETTAAPAAKKRTTTTRKAKTK